MPAYPPVFASVLVAFCVITPVQAEEIKNADGTYTSSTTVEDVQSSLPAKTNAVATGTNHTPENAKATAAESAKMFPNDAIKKAQKEQDRARMTPEELEKEKKMLDRTPPSAGIKVNNPNLTETNSIPKRN